MNKFRLPDTSQRMVVMGSTGSGKTRFALWALSHSHFDKQPYIILDYKRDDLIEQIDYIKEIGLNELPKASGLYVLKPHPNTDEEAINKWLWRVWERGKTGLFADEAYSMPQGKATVAILTQGRSKRIPFTLCTQRPAWLSRFVFSEASFFSIFRLADDEDVKASQRFVPLRHGRIDGEMARFHSRYYDRDQDKLYSVNPVPDDDHILERFYDRLKPKRKAL